MKIIWTFNARLTYFKVLDFINKEWTINEVENFVHKTEHTIAQIAENPYLFKASEKKKNVRKGFITEHNSLYYRIKPTKKEIELIAFWDNRRDPLKLKH
jgi:plasmid stabilization system protein ParE